VTLPPPRILIADDQPDILQALRLLLKGEGYEIDTATSPAEVALLLQERDFDVILLDLNYTRDTTSGEEGLDLLRRIRAVYPALPVVVMTAWGSVEGAVEAMRRGARDYVEKPWENQRLLAIAARAGGARPRAPQTQRLEDENRRLRHGGDPRHRRRVAGDAELSRDGGADRALRRQRADHRGARHREGGDRPPPARRLEPRSKKPLMTCTPAGSPPGCSRASCSGT
jgi:CheY-like chemotaxis protein